MTKPTTLADLRQTDWADPARYRRTVKDELRQNLVRVLETGAPIFPGIVGYEDTVVPQVINAVLARHNFILLGLRGQAKSRILRQLVTLLDPEIPIIAGSEINDNPFAPISKYGRQQVEQHGDRTPIAWVTRDYRYVEKLATPDVTIADIIGDVDPIKAARGGHLLSDELTIHYGLLPRSNRISRQRTARPGRKIRSGRYNIMQGDVQIKAPIRLALDILLSSASPEDYTAAARSRRSDRIGAV
jgi:magnesium chelatase subunit I